MGKKERKEKNAKKGTGFKLTGRGGKRSMREVEKDGEVF